MPSRNPDAPERPPKRQERPSETLEYGDADSGFHTDSRQRGTFVWRGASDRVLYFCQLPVPFLHCAISRSRNPLTYVAGITLFSRATCHPTRRDGGRSTSPLRRVQVEAIVRDIIFEQMGKTDFDEHRTFREVEAKP